ncbi:uncharacterized protein NECHADRAFT_76711 [Fusarium vanettenii 77-13-4]|uniref:Uncharacterized protein n=1 Tax=Fusarium vanettenii (strain ATCC MYA-4622 / CBS 123669 / FGSC 9596 / NRRL 45880 / 77-13-4) TaxID=660122 RepID=C7Z513_FUSV7|nr:uncharacterized protein NECHADRAFT_76711 [Fusarium vanettenii 77-13-4]EEU41020.1 predicted protein [Fusarium vanettenii 77-13-4]
MHKYLHVAKAAPADLDARCHRSFINGRVAAQVTAIRNQLNQQVRIHAICLTFSSSGVQYLRMVTAVDPEWLIDREFFRDENIPRNWHGDYRNRKVKESFDRARAAQASRQAS